MTQWRTIADLSDADRNHLIFWLVILLGVVIAGFGIIMMVRRYLRDPTASAGQDAGFSLSELRAMRDRGEITPEEYEITRARVIEKVKAMTHKPQPGTRRENEPHVPPPLDDSADT